MNITKRHRKHVLIQNTFLTEDYNKYRKLIGQNKILHRQGSIPQPINKEKSSTDLNAIDISNQHEPVQNVDKFGLNNDEVLDIFSDHLWDTDIESEDIPISFDHSGQSAYKDYCRCLGVIPTSYYLKHMKDRRLRMRFHGFSTSGIKAISTSLVSNANIVKLDLSDNWIEKDGFQAICQMLKENCFITNLKLSRTKLEADFVEHLAFALQSNVTLTHIDLSGNFIGDQGAEIFAEIINNTKKLEYLNISHNRFGEAAGLSLGPAVSENTSIKSIDLSWNSIRRKGAVAVALGIKNNVYLKKCDLSWNGFGVEGATALGDALKTNAALEDLNISDNRITPEGAVWISKGLMFNDNLTSLKIGRNPIESAGIYAICNSILKNQSIPLKYVDFENIEANYDADKIMKDVKRVLPDIIIIHSGSTISRPTRTRIHPMYKLKHYIEKHDLRIVDFFTKFDKDNSLSVSKKEFLQGILETGIRLTEDELNVLIDELDKDGNGEVNYSELVVGHKDYTDKESKLQSVPMITVKD